MRASLCSAARRISPTSPCAAHAGLQVADGLFVSGEAVARDRAILAAHGISHVVNCVGQLYPEFFARDGIVYKTLWLQGARVGGGGCGTRLHVHGVRLQACAGLPRRQWRRRQLKGSQTRCGSHTSHRGCPVVFTCCCRMPICARTHTHTHTQTNRRRTSHVCCTTRLTSLRQHARAAAAAAAAAARRLSRSSSGSSSSSSSLFQGRARRLALRRCHPHSSSSSSSSSSSGRRRSRRRRQAAAGACWCTAARACRAARPSPSRTSCARRAARTTRSTALCARCAA
jgi:hypothetical protein